MLMYKRKIWDEKSGCECRLVNECLNLVGFDQFGEFLVKTIVVFYPIRVGDDAVQRTDADAGRLVVKTDTFGAQVRIDFIDFVTHVNRLVRAFRLAHVAVDATFDDFKCHLNSDP